MSGVGLRPCPVIVLMVFEPAQGPQHRVFSRLRASMRAPRRRTRPPAAAIRIEALQNQRALGHYRRQHRAGLRQFAGAGDTGAARTRALAGGGVHFAHHRHVVLRYIGRHDRRVVGLDLDVQLVQLDVLHLHHRDRYGDILRPAALLAENNRHGDQACQEQHGDGTRDNHPLNLKNRVPVLAGIPGRAAS